MSTSPYFSHAAAGGARAPPPAGAVAAAAAPFKVPKLNKALYNCAVVVLSFDDNITIKQVQIPVYYDKITNEAAFIQNARAFSGLCDIDDDTVQSGLASLFGDNPHFKLVIFIVLFLQRLDVTGYDGGKTHTLLIVYRHVSHPVVSSCVPNNVFFV